MRRGPAARVIASRPMRAALVLGAALWSGVAGAQQADSARVGAQSPRPSATAGAASRARPVNPATVPPVTPGGAFLRSALLPGLGQAALDRPVAGAVFATAEALALAMWRKSAFDLREARRFAGDSLIVEAFSTANGREVLDSLGRPVVGASRTNRWRQGNIAAARSTFREDWIAAVVFIHLLSGLDAFVAAQLWDLPAQVSLRPSPMGGATLTLGYRWR